MQLDEINTKYAQLIVTFLFQKKENEKIFYDLIDSMLIQEIIYNDLVQNFVELKNLLNNLYDYENYGKIDEIWCQSIEKKYDLNSNIYMPKLNEKSFLFLFIKIKNIYMEKELGYIFDAYTFIKSDNLKIIEDLYYDFREFCFSLENKQIPQLILEIGNILIHSLLKENKLDYFKELESLCQ